MHLNNLNIVGIIMILFGIFLFITNYLDTAILEITYHFLEGSSEGKSVLFFTIMGSLLLFYPLFKSDGKIMGKLSSVNPIFKGDSRKYLKFTIIVILITFIVGIMLEIWIRVKFGVSPFTTFVSMNPSVSTTSITHSHVLKSVLGSLISPLGMHVPSHINTGVSIAQYISPLAYVIFIAFPVVYLTGMISLNGRRDLHKLILAFALTLSIIGMLDGGLFSTPATLGLWGLLIIYAIKKPFLKRQLIIPTVIIIMLILLRFSVSMVGTDTDHYEISVIDLKSAIDLQGYDILSIENQGNKTIVKVPGRIGEKKLLFGLTESLKGKCSGFFLSWNAYSYL